MTEEELKKYGIRPYCPCGSGDYRHANYDARGIFLTYTCDHCHDRKMQGYRQDVLDDPSYWHDEPIDSD